MVSVIMPAYNEGRKIAGVLEMLKSALREISQPYEIIVVDDGSTDDTGKRARDFGAEVIGHRENLGYGRSLKDGIRASRGEAILLIDADGTYEVDNIPKMLSMMEHADMVVGKRVFSQERTDHFKDIARRFFAYHTSYYSGKKIEDLNSGLRVFRKRDVIDKLDLFPDGFSFTSTLTVRHTLEKNKKIIYIPVKYNHRSEGSKFVSRPHIYSIAKLTLALTFKARPWKLSIQLALTLITAALLSNIIGSLSHAHSFVKMLLFVIAYPFIFMLFLCYIYAKGRKVCG